MINIGIIGHRYLYNGATIDFVIKHCTSILQNIKKNYSQVVALSAIAEGSDMIFAEVASTLNIPLEIVKPYNDYINDFSSQSLKSRYLNLKQKAVKEIKLPYKERCENAYFDAMQWVVKKSDILIAVWDGEKNNGMASTASTIEAIKKNNGDWIHLDIVYNCTRFYLSNNVNYLKTELYENFS